jgi:hypothetical protein
VEGGEGEGAGASGGRRETVERPSLDLLRKVAKSAAKGNGPLSAEVRAVLDWVLGNGQPEDINGLVACMAAIPTRGKGPATQATPPSTPPAADQGAAAEDSADSAEDLTDSAEAE